MKHTRPEADKYIKLPAKLQGSIKYTPRTPFGRRIMEYRKFIEASGEMMLSNAEVEKEVQRRRGER